ncbi:MAG: hypothetical protein E7425_08490 [Ruminococcaceae bacterium]|jgi:hypothetical protein|nr:hypothetical protein [Oscillospiraceae bacterium]
MHQTDRRTEPAKRSAQDKDRAERKQSRESQKSAAQALEAILAGGSWEQLSTDGILTLSHTVGNSALLDMLALRSMGPEAEISSLPDGACGTAPAEWGGGEPLCVAAPDFGAMSPMGAAAPLSVSA